MMKRPGKQFVAPSQRGEPHYIVPRETIDDAWLALLASLDRSLAALPAKLAPLVAAEPDPSKREAIIAREVNALLREFDTSKAAMLDSIAATQH
jgi:hypothetical protein